MTAVGCFFEDQGCYQHRWELGLQARAVRDGGGEKSRDRGRGLVDVVAIARSLVMGSLKMVESNGGSEGGTS